MTPGRFMLRERGSGIRSTFETVASEAGVLERSTIAFELPSNEAVRAAVEAGIGVTAISASVAALSLEAGLLVQVASVVPERAFTLVRHKERHRSGAEEAFVGMIRSRK